MVRATTLPAAIRLLVLDVDGVLTDGRLYYGPRGEVLKVFHVLDGHGIREAQRAGIEVAVISGRDSAAVRRRCRDLGIRHVFQGVADKLPVFERLCRRLRILPIEAAIIGDDVPDVPMMQVVGLAFAVPDAHQAARRAADHTTSARGGRGAVREVCDLLCAASARRPRKSARKRR
ncbi:MAG TPA: HAD-IIIA family hydrolase [Steroidobacteraceae bacterium]|nr:HAD-IIIA family hydrolase [Steroidobacteraceae bacterium]HNS26868.1 HAD-IIIA family hydrolase [Steroidobacteraceae bacterium]